MKLSKLLKLLRDFNSTKKVLNGVGLTVWESKDIQFGTQDFVDMLDTYDLTATITIKFGEEQYPYRFTVKVAEFTFFTLASEAEYVEYCGNPRLIDNSKQMEGWVNNEV